MTAKQTDAMTKADAARERVMQAVELYTVRHDITAYEILAKECDAYGDRRAVEAEIAALRRCFGQHDPDGALYFVVRVEGIGARSVSALAVSKALAEAWSGVHIADYPIACTPHVTVADDLLADAEQREREMP